MSSIFSDDYPPPLLDPYARSYMHKPVMETFTGLEIPLIGNTPEAHIQELIPLINIEDIAHHLAMYCRYSGACKIHWSVAAHSLLVRDIVEYLVFLHGDGKQPSLDLRLASLLHDAHEVYCGDAIKGMKMILGPLYIPVANTFQEAIHQKYNILLNDEDERFLKAADNMALGQEAKYIMKSHGKGWDCMPIPRNTKLEEPPVIMPIRPYDIAYIEQMYLKALNQLVS
jgi:hypothetical protein